MFARLLAVAGCLLSFAPCFGQTELVSPLEHTVVVYLHQPNPRSPIIQNEMQRETAALLAPAGYGIEWRGVTKSDIGRSEDDPVVVVELRGACDAVQPLNGKIVANGTSLASTAVVNGEVLPFSWLECEMLTGLLAPRLKSETIQEREHLYGRAMGRLLAHELFHILTNGQKHEAGGIGKSAFSAKELLATVFEFEPQTLAKLRDSPFLDDDDSTNDSSTDVGGR